MSISRRDALMGATAAVAVAGVPTAVGVKAALAGPTVEPLLALEREWFAYRDYVNGDLPDESDEALAPMHVRLGEMVERIYLTPAQTIQGALAKLRVWSADCGEFQQVFFTGAWWHGDPTSMHWSDRGFAGVMCDLERLAGEARP